LCFRLPTRDPQPGDRQPSGPPGVQPGPDRRDCGLVPGNHGRSGCHAVRPGHQPGRAPRGIFDTELFTEDRGRAAIFLPCDPLPQPAGRVSTTVIPPANRSWLADLPIPDQAITINNRWYEIRRARGPVEWPTSRLLENTTQAHTKNSPGCPAIAFGVVLSVTLTPWPGRVRQSGAISPVSSSALRRFHSPYGRVKARSGA
jgi:hypothetical protein